MNFANFALGDRFDRVRHEMGHRIPQRLSRFGGTDPWTRFRIPLRWRGQRLVKFDSQPQKRDGAAVPLIKNRIDTILRRFADQQIRPVSLSVDDRRKPAIKFLNDPSFSHPRNSLQH